MRVKFIMKNINFIKCESDSQLKEVAGLANIIWHEYFPFLLSEDQINYMVEKFQSYQAMKDQIQNQNYTYYQIHLDDQLIGYMGLALESSSLFISKLYLRKEGRNQGISRLAFEKIKEIAKENQKEKLYLTCNKYNTHSLDVYDHWGFQRVDSVVTDIGKGYVMDDYILEYKL